jgi:2-polyprenyl-3-methyl-5-hydroxy-6-metoxy-1,4-benzoquinol methylase
MDQIAPISLQQSFWNRWNASTREKAIDEVSMRQATVVSEWLNSFERTDFKILEVGCGAAWFSPCLARYGRVTATDLSDEVLERAKRRVPEVAFVPGDFMSVDFGTGCFDVVVTLEVLSCVADQLAFISKIASHLRPNGHLMLATPNRFVLQHLNRIGRGPGDIPPPEPGQLRHWTDRRELRGLLEHEFDVLELFSVTPRANRGVMRLINSRTFNRPVRALLGNRVERFKETMGLGWTLMALARKRVQR